MTRPSGALGPVPGPLAGAYGSQLLHNGRMPLVLSAVTVTLAVALEVALGGCTGSSAERPRETAPSVASPSPSPVWSASFVQERPDQDSPFADVKVTSHATEQLRVTGVRLRWSGYGARSWQPVDFRYQPGYTYGLDVRLPRPQCDGDGADPPQAQLRIAHHPPAVVPIDAVGAAALRTVWERQCGEQRLLQAVDVDFDPSWQPVRRGGDPLLLGHLTARRGQSDAEVTLSETLGSVLLILEPAGEDRLLLGRGQDTGRLPIEVASTYRCDAHALSQSSQTFKLRVWLRLDGGPEHSLVLVPAGPARAQMNSLIREACDLT